jgi:HD-GYP domain-containing protein (c-di-GMP phosphodiesterase class II)
VASRIIRVANAYDDFAGGSMESQQRLRALSRLREGAAEEYDPMVVDIVARVVERTMLVDV